MLQLRNALVNDGALFGVQLQNALVNEGALFIVQLQIELVNVFTSVHCLLFIGMGVSRQFHTILFWHVPG